MGVTHGLQTQQRAVRAHAQRADHRQSDFRGFLQILAGARGRLLEIQQLGATTCQQHLDPIAQFGCHMQALVFHRRHQGDTQRLATRQDGDLFHPADLECRGHQGMAGFMHGNALAIAA